MRRLALVSLVLTTTMVLFASCSSYNRMRNRVDKVDAYATPELLVLKGQAVTADVTYTFPPRYFYEEMIIKVTPVLVYDGGEIAGPAKYFQGEDVRDNYTPVSWKKGGEFTQQVVFPYDPRASVSTLELRFEGRTADQCRSDKHKEFAPFGSLDVASGISTLQALASMPYMTMMPHNFTKTQTITQTADIHYNISSSAVRNNQLSQEQIKMFEAFVKENSNNPEVTLGNVYAKGYASPDGPQAFNDKLSSARSKSGEKAIKGALKGVDVAYDAAAYGEDWDGFKKLVQESNIADKDLILQVLSMYDSASRREQEIKNLSAVYNELRRNILPELRRTQLVATTEIKAKTDAEILSAIDRADKSLTANEMLYGATLVDNDKAIAIYRMAANQYNDARAYNNLAIALVKNEDVVAAKQAIEQAAKLESSPVITNNLAAVAIAQGDVASAKRYLSALDSADARSNRGMIALAEGDYVAAAKDLKGYNLAVVETLNGNYAQAKAALATCDCGDKCTCVNCNCAENDYLRAIIATREGNSAEAIANLKKSIAKNPELKARAQRDIEFSRLFGNAEFKAL